MKHSRPGTFSSYALQHGTVITCAFWRVFACSTDIQEPRVPEFSPAFYRGGLTGKLGVPLGCQINKPFLRRCGVGWGGGGLQSRRTHHSDLLG